MYHLFSRNRTRLNLGPRLKHLALPPITLAVSVAATSALASTLTLIPIPPWATNNLAGDPNRGGVMHQNEGRSITPDGRFVVGLCYDRTNRTVLTNIDEVCGYFYNVPDGSVSRPVCGSYASAVTGVGYRTNASGAVETIADGFGGGWKSEFMTTNGGTNWTGKVRSVNINFTSAGGPVLPLANTMGASANSDVYYSIIQGFLPYEDSLEYAFTWRGSNAWSAANLVTNRYFQIQRGDGGWGPVDTGNRVRMHGVSATGRSVGHYVDGGVEWLGGVYPGYYDTYGAQLNFVIEWPPPVMGGAGSSPYNMTNVWPFAGLDGTLKGAAWAISPDGNTIFGHSPTNTGSPWYGYKALATAEVESVTSVTQLPILPDTAGKPGPGVTWAVIPFGCSADGRYAVGVIYRGTEKGERAALWDTGDADANNWTVVDLTEIAASEGVLGSFTKLERAYSVGVNESGYPVITGYGKYLDGATVTNRAFVLVAAPVPPRPQITSITGAGTGTITVNYTNTIAGKLYALRYCTNLNNAASWYPAGSKTASGTTDFQTESSVTSSQRYYRLSYTP